MATPFQDLRILVAEDHNDFILLLKIMLEQMGFRHIHAANNYHEALTVIEKHAIDVFLVDIDLGEIKNGVMLGEEIRRRNISSPIIYITANYTMEYYAYARVTKPSSFLNKELSFLKLHQAIDLALFSPVEEDEVLVSKKEDIPQILPYNFYFRIGDTYKAIPVGDIMYFFADKKMSYAKIGSRSYPTSVQLKTLEEELSAEQFIRVHKSYIVNTKFIETINPGEASIVINGETLPIGYAYRKAFMAALRLLK